jgi:hypothetical protein
VTVLDADVWTSGGLPPDATAGFASMVRSAWQDGGRECAPLIVAPAYFGLGDIEEASREPARLLRAAGR